MHFYKVITNTLRTKRPIELQWFKSTNPLVPEMYNFIRKNFYPNEPVSRSLNLINNPEDVKTMDFLCQRSVTFDASAIALDPNTKQIIGIFLNDIVERGAYNNYSKLDASLKPSYAHRKYFEIAETMRNDVDLFGKYPEIDKIMEHFIASVDEKWQRDGVFNIMQNFTNEIIARKLECPLSFGICTNYATAKIEDSCGYEIVWSMKFSDIKENGKVLFFTEPPNDNLVGKLYDKNLKYLTKNK